MIKCSGSFKKGIIAGLILGSAIIILYYLGLFEDAPVCLVEYSLSKNRFLIILTIMAVGVAARLMFGPIRKWSSINIIEAWALYYMGKKPFWLSKFISNVFPDLIPSFIYCMAVVIVILNAMLYFDDDYGKIHITSILIVAALVGIMIIYTVILKTLINLAASEAFREAAIIILIIAISIGITFSMFGLLSENESSFADGCSYINIAAFFAAAVMPYFILKIPLCPATLMRPRTPPPSDP